MAFIHYKDSVCENSLFSFKEGLSPSRYHDVTNEDDIPKIYEEFEKADMVIFGIPTYVGHVSAIFKTWEERGLGIYGLDELYQKLEKKTYSFIVIGSHSVLDEAMRRFYRNPKVAWILLRSREYGLDPLKKGLIEVPDVINRLDTFMQTLLRLATQKNH